tara:strand:+ start:2925 stop:3053 length:129 start_codon:yes stop_codon:yes gene_type:complete
MAGLAETGISMFGWAMAFTAVNALVGPFMLAVQDALGGQNAS